MQDTRKPLSKTASRRVLFGLIVVTVFLAYLAALGIQSASENQALQEEIIEMRRQFDPNFKETDSTTSTEGAKATDSAAAPVSDSTVSN